MDKFNPTTLTDEVFASYRYIQDEYADNVATALVAIGASYINPQDTARFHQLAFAVISMVKTNSDVISIDSFKKILGPIAIPDKQHIDAVALFVKYFANREHFQFTDDQKSILKKGCLFYSTHAFEATITLAVRSLLKQYAASNAIQVLVSTNLLPQYPHRRVLSTMDFVLDVMALNAFEPDGSGILAIQKLRLVHALIRARIKDESEHPEHTSDELKTDTWPANKWNAAEWGLPINQQDMIFAIHTFSVEVLDGIIEAGDKVTADDINNYYVTWHYIATALGLRAELNPYSYSDGKELQQRIYNKQFKANPNSPKLAAPLIEFLIDFTGLSQANVYALTSLFNNETDRGIFEDILKIPLRSAPPRYRLVLKLSQMFFSFWSIVRYFGFRDTNVRLAQRTNDTMQQVVYSQSTWGSKHFRMRDGFGNDAAQKDASNNQKKPSIFKVAFKMFFFGIETIK